MPTRRWGANPQLLIQATKAFNEHHTCIQPCTKGWERIKGKVSSSSTSFKEFGLLGELEHHGRERKECKRSRAFLLRKEMPEQEVDVKGTEAQKLATRF